MVNESEPKVCDNAIPPPKIEIKRYFEDEDRNEVIAKKQKIDEVVVKQEVKEENNSDYSEHDKKLETKNESDTGCGSLKSSDDGVSDHDSHGISDEDNPEDLESPEYNEEEIEGKVSKTPQEKHETPVSLNEKYAALKTIIVRNLSYSVERADMEDIFKDCGEVVDVRFNTDREGRFKGYGYVEFGTAEAAEKALDLNNKVLLNRRIKVDIALEKGEYPPHRSSFHTGGDLQSQSAKGFDASLAENKPKSPVPNETNGASKTIYVRNLSYSMERADMEEFFKDCGEIVDVRLHTDRDGNFKGYGHVQFATAEAAQKALAFNRDSSTFGSNNAIYFSDIRRALDLNNTVLLNRRINVDIALETGEYPPHRSSFHTGGDLQSQTAKGFDASLAENKPKSPAPNETNGASKTIYVRNLSYSVERADMEEFFKDCGEIVDVRLHTDRDGNFKGYGHVQFATAEAAQKALAFNKKVFFNRLMFVGLALERGKYPPNGSSSWSSSLHKDERLQSQTVPVKCSTTSLVEGKLNCAKEVKDVEMFDAASVENKVPETPATQKEENAASKTVCVRNVSFDVERAEIENIFKDCGDVVDVRLHVDVEFATAEEAEKALELDYTRLTNHPVKVGMAPAEGECFPNKSVSIPFSKCETFQPLTVFAIGFDTSPAEEKIKATLKNHFSSCGEITRISLPRHHGSCNIKGYAHLDFKDIDGYKKALQLDQSAIGDFWLSVEKAKPKQRRDYQGIGGSRDSYHGGGGRYGGDYGGGAGWGRSHGAGRHY